MSITSNALLVKYGLKASGMGSRQLSFRVARRMPEWGRETDKRERKKGRKKKKDKKKEKKKKKEQEREGEARLFGRDQTFDENSGALLGDELFNHTYFTIVLHKIICISIRQSNSITHSFSHTKVSQKRIQSFTDLADWFTHFANTGLS